MRLARKKNILFVFLFSGIIILASVNIYLLAPSLFYTLSSYMRAPVSFLNNARFLSHNRNNNDLKIILESAKEDDRLQATRRIAENAGPLNALEMLKNAGLPYTGESHLVAHQIGYVAFNKYGKDALLYCKDYFLFACYHGAIIKAISELGIEDMVEMLDRCRDWNQRFYQCSHALGHSFLAYTNYNLPEALIFCDTLLGKSKEIQYPGALTYCHNGVFMENIFGVHDWGVREIPKRNWLSDKDIYFPCNAVGDAYQEGCWMNQASRIYQMMKGNLRKTAIACDEVQNDRHRSWCYDNFGRQIHPLTYGDVEKVFSLCDYATGDWKESCMINNAGAYYSVGDRDLPFKVCRKMTGSSKKGCYDLLSGQISEDRIAESEKNGLCNKMEREFIQHCKKI